MKKILCLLGLFCLLIIQPAFATATIEIENVDTERLKNALVKNYMMQGLNVEIINQNTITATQIIRDDFVMSLVRATSDTINNSTSRNNYTQRKYNYTFVQNGKNTIIQLTITYITNPNTFNANTIYADVNQEINALNQLKANVIGFYTYGFSYIPKKNFLKVANIYAGQPAENSKLKAGYLIIAIDDKPISLMNNAAIKEAFGNTLKTTKFTVQENKNTEPFEVILQNKLIKPIEL